MNLTLMIKKIDVKTLVSGDKSARITLETISPEDVIKLAALSGEIEVDVTFDESGKK